MCPTSAATGGHAQSCCAADRPQHPPQHHQPQHHKPRQQSRRQRHSSRPPRHRQSAAASQPRSGGTLRAALTADLPNLDPHINTTTAHENLFLAFDRLIQYDDQLQPQPMLAESWDLSSDLKQIKFNLRKGVQFHTGREFTSDDVKWNLLRVRDPKSPSVGFRNQSNWFTTIETPDKYTIILKSEQPRPALFDSSST